MNHFYRGYHLQKQGLFKASACLLAFLLLISPVAQVFADNTAPVATTSASAFTTTTSAPVDQNTPTPTSTTPVTAPTDPTVTTPVSTTPTSTTPTADATANSTTTPAAKVTPLATPSVPVNNASSIVQNSTFSHNLVPKADPTTGAMVYDYSIDIPPGRNGMQPDLKLQYNSQNTTEDNFLGYGWTVNIPYISRLNKKGVADLYSATIPNSYFTSSLDGELVLASTSGTKYTYISRVETGGFNSYVFDSSVNTWTLTTKAGLTYLFGTTAASRQDNPGNAAQIAKWFVDKQSDSNGNFITYSYIKDQGQIYPNAISYTNTSGGSGIYQINFTYQTRPDAATSYTWGFSVITAKRLLEIEATSNGTWVQHYDPSYSISSGSGRSLLGSITQSSKSDVGVISTLPDTSFTYQQATAGISSTAGWTLPQISSVCCTGGAPLNKTLSFGTGGSVPTGKIIDVNGDGLPDIVYTTGTITPTSTDPGAEVWINNGSNGWTLNSSWSFPVLSTSGGIQYTFNLDSHNVRFVDVNSDGLMDIIVDANGDLTSTASPKTAVYLNTGSGWVESPAWELPVIYTNTSGTNYTVSFNQYNVADGMNENPVRFVDVNNDGRPDIVYATGCAGNTCNGLKSSVIINTGSGWYIDPAWQLPTIPGQTAPNNVSNLAVSSNIPQVVDINGDGLPDILDAAASTTACGYTSGGYFKNTGSGWALDSCWDHTNFPGYSSQLVDVNNDGLPDVITASGIYSSTTPTVYLNNGAGWTASTHWTFPLLASLACGVNTTFTFREVGASCGFDFDGNTRVVDFNGDNLPDIDQGTGQGSSGATGLGMYFNNNSSMTFSSGTTAGGYFSTMVGDYTQAYDVNSDGLPDYVFTDLNGCLYSSINCPGGSTVSINAGAKSDILSTVTSPTGATTTLSYTLVPVKSFATPAEGQNQPMYVVTKISTNDGNGIISNTSFTYSGGSFYSGSSTDRRFAGFAKIITTDPAGNVTNTYYHTGNGTDTTHGEYADNYWKIGMPYRVEQYDGSGNLYAKTINKWDSTVSALNALSAFVRLAQTVRYTYDGTGSHKDTAESYTYTTTTGNMSQKISYGQVTGNDDGTFTDTGTDLSTTNYTYATQASTNKYQISDQTVLDQSSTKVAESRYYYDTLALGSLTAGNLTKQEDWKTGTTYINSQKAYNSYGLVTSTTDPRGKITSYGYDTYNLYPLTATDPLTHVTHYTYNYGLGKVATITDPNGSVWSTTYDGFGRPLVQSIPDPTGGSSPVAKTAYVYTDTSGAVSVHQTDYLDATTSFDTYQYFDGLGRLIQNRKEAEIAGNFNVRDTVYNTLGLVAKQSLNYTGSGSAKSSPTTDPTLYTTISYDPLQRTLSSVNNIGTTSYVYNLWKTSVTDPRGKVKDQYADARGNLIEVDEHNSGSTYVTAYTWNLNGKLLSITDALGNVRNFTYDGLGLRATAQDLHASADTTYGSWSYTYDNAGNLTQSISPLAATVNYTYDDTNRVLTEDYTGGAGTETTYTYDTCTKGIGRLCTATVLAGAASVYTYDQVGNIASDQETINATVYTTSYTYDRQGNQLIITYPDSAQVRYTYNTAGLLEKIERKESGGSFTDVVSNFDYSPMDQVVTQADANGTTTTNTYDATNLYRLTNKKTNGFSSNNNPVITLTGASLINLAIGATWTDPGYTATDVEDGNLTASVTKTGTVNTAVAGIYQVVYAVVDSGGAPAARMIRTVVVGTLIPTKIKTLVVGGGGGTGNISGYQSGGGGGGEYKYDAAHSVYATSYPITIGTGGTGATNGNSSTFDTITAIGGGAGGIGRGDGASGSSGGGGSGSNTPPTNGGTGTTGTSGGSGDNNSGGGGGGAGTAGSNGLGSVSPWIPNGGNGGNGISNSITGTAVYYAGGGGGGGGTSGAVHGNGGLGGGGNGGDSTSNNGVAGTNGLGGGAGGAGGSTFGLGAKGGDGVVIISYPTASFGTCIGGTKTTSGANTIHTFTSSGTFTVVAGTLPPNTNPIITLSGATLINKTVGDTWTESGYSATDAEDGNLTASVVVTGSVNTAVAGTYQLVYSVADSQGAPAASMIRTVVVYPPTYIQNATYTYDANNNITQLVDSSSTSTSKTITYTYDDLNRMTQATATAVATGQTTYTQNYVYNAIGDITSGPVGAYVYNGSTGTNYANPHAATSINSVTNTYDKDGNVLTDGTLTNTWNYKDQLTQVVKGATTTTYQYDSNGNRVRALTGTTNTYYPTKYYTYDGTTKTKDIYAGNTLVASVTTVGATVTPYYDHTDQLGGIIAATNSMGAQTESLDYYPFGNQRISTGGYTSICQYIGERYDSSGLNYLNARYYNSVQGRFISEDPSFLALGDSGRTLTMTGMNLNTLLMDPQLLNSYSYGRDNPITNMDSNGKWFKEFLANFNPVSWGRGQSWSSFKDELNQASYQLSQNSSEWKFAMDHPLATGAITAVASIPAVLTGESAAAAYRMATFQGIGSIFATQQAIAGTVYFGLTISSTLAIPELVKPFSEANQNQPSSFYSATFSVAKEVGVSVAGRQVEAIGGTADVMQVGGMIGKAVTNFINNLFPSNNSQKSSSDTKN